MDAPTKHVCGVCHDEWLTEEEYNHHTCPVSGFAPVQIEHLVATTTPDFVEISQAAQQRGAEDVTPAQPVPLDAPGLPVISLG